MLTNPHEYRSCTVKRRYRDPANALIAAQSQSRKFREQIFAYECRYCGPDSYHLGHSPWQVRKFIAELVKSDEFLKTLGLTVRPLSVKVYDPALVH